MNMPTINHPTGRPNYTVVSTNDTTYWFSYKTCIAFQSINMDRPMVQENRWGPTTGKHLNAVDGGSTMAKNRRVTYHEFVAALEQATALVPA